MSKRSQGPDPAAQVAACVETIVYTGRIAMCRNYGGSQALRLAESQDKRRGLRVENPRSSCSIKPGLAPHVSKQEPLQRFGPGRLGSHEIRVLKALRRAQNQSPGSDPPRWRPAPEVCVSKQVLARNPMTLSRAV